MISKGKSQPHPYRSLSIEEWPEADRAAWEVACRPGQRLRPGGPASGFAQASREDFVRRYGAFLGFLHRNGRLRDDAAATALVTEANVQPYVAELQDRVSTVTAWNCVYKLRRAAELMAPETNLGWLAEIEKDLALVMRPRSKYDRLVFSDQLAEAGLTLMLEARRFATSEFQRAIGIRNGLMLTTLALCPTRLKNFAALEIGSTFRDLNGSWWITLPKRATKSKRQPEERRLPDFMRPLVDLYISEARPVLITEDPTVNGLWISSRTGLPYTRKNLGTLISKLTLRTLGVDVSPHLFRTAAATTAAAYAPHLPYLASAVLGHSDPRVTEEHYNRASAVNAASIYATIVDGLITCRV